MLPVDLIKDEQVYKLLFDTAAEGLLLVDSKGKILLSNSRALDLFGYDSHEVVGMDVDQLVPIDIRGMHTRHREAYMIAPERRSMGMGLNLTGLRKDGTSLPVEISLNHTYIDNKLVVMALITDITKRKAAEAELEALNVELEALNVELEQRVAERTRELKESQRLYSLIARNFPNGTINVFDRQFNYVFVEGRELFRLGVTSQQLVGTNFLDRVPDELKETFRSHFERVFEGEDLNFEVTYGEATYELHCVGLDGMHGRVHHILVVEHDITKLKQAEVEIRRALVKEKELNELKSRFVSMASHEFRTPLSTILTSLSLAQKYDAPQDSEKRNKHFARIRSSVHNLTGILNDFLSFDKLESGHIQPKPIETNLRQLLQDVVEELQGIAKTGQQIELSFEGEPTAFLDAGFLRNVLVNLISNAIKYSDEGKTIFISAVADGTAVKIQVKDQGIGIPEADKAHLFQRFFRANNATNIQGTGLGLTIVKRYIILLEGEIWLDSMEGKGTTFTFIIPQFAAT